jgi:TolA-binding protein
MNQNNIPASTYWKKHRVFKILLIIFPLILYGMTFSFEYVLDDELYITHHPTVQKGISGIPEIFMEKSLSYMDQNGGQQPYRPITLTSYAIEKTLFDSHSIAAHITNVFIFIAIGFGLFHLLLLWFPQIHISILFSVILLFIAHPIHTEVIANVKSRDELLTMLFGILSLIFFWKYHSESNQKKHLISSLILFLMACLSKENGITWLGIFPLSLYFFKKESFLNSIKKSIVLIIPTVLFLVLWGTINKGNVTVIDLDPINNILFQSVSFQEILATKVLLIGTYLKLLLFPITLSWDYSFNQIPIVDFSAIYSILSGVTILSLIVFAFKGFTHRKVYSFWILFFIILFSASSNLIIKIGATMAERFIFIPSLAFCFLLAWGLIQMLNITPTSFQGNRKNIFIGVISIILLLYSFKTIKRNRVWKNNLTLSESGVISSPNSARTHFSFAVHSKYAAYKEHNTRKQRIHFQNAESNFKKSIEIYPEYINARYNLGVFYFETGQSDLAFKAYSDLIEFSPTHINSLNNMGTILFNSKNYDEAQIYLNKVLKMDPNHSDALINMGAIAHNTGNLANAIDYYEKSLQQTPLNTIALKNIIIAYGQLGDSEKRAYYQNILNEIQPK